MWLVVVTGAGKLPNYQKDGCRVATEHQTRNLTAKRRQKQHRTAASTALKHAVCTVQEVFGVLTAVSTMIVLTMAVRTSETSVNLYQLTRRYNTEGSHLQSKKF
jgi:hypothetical protein